MRVYISHLSNCDSLLSRLSLETILRWGSAIKAAWLLKNANNAQLCLDEHVVALTQALTTEISSIRRESEARARVQDSKIALLEESNRTIHGLLREVLSLQRSAVISQQPHSPEHRRSDPASSGLLTRSTAADTIPIATSSASSITSAPVAAPASIVSALTGYSKPKYEVKTLKGLALSTLFYDWYYYDLASNPNFTATTAKDKSRITTTVMPYMLKLVSTPDAAYLRGSRPAEDSPGLQGWINRVREIAQKVQAATMDQLTQESVALGIQDSGDGSVGTQPSSSSSSSSTSGTRRARERDFHALVSSVDNRISAINTANRKRSKITL